MNALLIVGAGWLGLNVAFFAWRWWATRKDPDVPLTWRERRGR